MSRSNRKSQIVQTAAHLFRKEGYQAVSMRDLADNLGIKAASLYNHISSKEEILALIIMDMARTFSEHIAEVRKNENSSVDKLTEIIDMHLRTTFHKTDVLACMNREWKHLNDDYRKTYLQLRNQYENDFLQIIENGMETGELRSLNPKILSNTFLSALRNLYHWHDRDPEFSEDRVRESVKDYLLSGLLLG